MSEALAVIGVGLCCSIGLDAAQVTASIRAGVSRKTESELLDGMLRPIVLGHLRERHLPAFVDTVRARHRASPIEPRMVRLGGRALAEALGGPLADPRVCAAIPLIVATPAPDPELPAFVSDHFVRSLAEQAQRPLELETSAALPDGRVGLFRAIACARERLLGPRPCEFVVVGGVDSYMHDDRLAALERAGRLRTAGPQDAFTPGEGAGFVVLARHATCRAQGLTPLAWIMRVATLDDVGRPLSTLAATCAQILDGVRVRAVMAGLNGESDLAREWGVARVRNRAQFGDPLHIEHPAEYFGDAGAALAPVMLGAMIGLLARQRALAPALVWAGADDGRRGALLVHAPT